MKVLRVTSGEEGILRMVTRDVCGVEDKINECRKMAVFSSGKGSDGRLCCMRSSRSFTKSTRGDRRLWFWRHVPEKDVARKADLMSVGGRRLWSHLERVLIVGYIVWRAVESFTKSPRGEWRLWEVRGKEDGCNECETMAWKLFLSAVILHWRTDENFIHETIRKGEHFFLRHATEKCVGRVTWLVSVGRWLCSHLKTVLICSCIVWRTGGTFTSETIRKVWHFFLRQAAEKCVGRLTKVMSVGG